jgi:stage II sporulation protein P
MRKPTVTFNVSPIGRIISSIGMMSRTFLILTALTFCFFILLSMAAIAYGKAAKMPVSSMQGLAAAVSTQFFVDMMGMEVPQLTENGSESTFASKKVAAFVFQFLTNINPMDPKTLLAREVPGLNKGNTFFLATAKGTDVNVFPFEYAPPAEALFPDPLTQLPVPETAPAGEETEPAVPPTATPIEPKGDEETKPVLSTNGKKVVFIYHSHNRESWIPELKHKGVTQLNDAYDSKTNVTLLGKRLADQLQDLGIGSVNSEKDYPTVIEGYNWNLSYKYSLNTVKEAFAANPDLTYYFDIHRDSNVRKDTTININGKNYAQVYFVVGLKNKNWEQNLLFSDKISKKMEEKYPGISRGTVNKPANSGHAEYNQSFSPNSILVEIGGPENTLEESYRTIDALAEAIAEIYWDAEKVDAPVSTPGNTTDTRNNAAPKTS